MANVVHNFAERILIAMKELLWLSDENNVMCATDFNNAIDRQDLVLNKPGRRSWYNVCEMLAYFFPDRIIEKKQGYYYIDRSSSISQNMMISTEIGKSKIIDAEDKKQLCEEIKNYAGPTYRQNVSADYMVVVNKFDNIAGMKEVTEGVRKAIMSKKKIRFQYTDFDRNFDRVKRHSDDYYYLFSPFKLEFDKNTCYVHGVYHLPEKDEHRNFRLDRMINVTITKETIINPASIYGKEWEKRLNEKIQNQYNHYGTERINLVLEIKCLPATYKIIYDMAGKTIEVEHNSYNPVKNTEIVRISTMRGPTLVGWLSAYVEFFRAIGPAEVVEDMNLHKKCLEEAYMEA